MGNIYFTSDIENKILQLITLLKSNNSNQEIVNSLFLEIKPAIDKIIMAMCRNKQLPKIIDKYNNLVIDLEEIKQRCYVKIIEELINDRYDKERNTLFSYLTSIINNYITQLSMGETKKLNTILSDNVMYSNTNDKRTYNNNNIDKYITQSAVVDEEEQFEFDNYDKYINITRLYVLFLKKIEYILTSNDISVIFNVIYDKYTPEFILAINNIIHDDVIIEIIDNDKNIKYATIRKIFNKFLKEYNSINRRYSNISNREQFNNLRNDFRRIYKMFQKRISDLDVYNDEIVNRIFVNVFCKYYNININEISNEIYTYGEYGEQ